MYILGAGMSGCLAGVLNSKAILFDDNPELSVGHKAVLRFREDKISKATGIPFRSVLVRKAIWMDHKEVALTPRTMNMYSRKVIGSYLERSISNMEPVHRFVAPDNFHEQLAERCAGRIKYGHKLQSISTEYLTFTNGELQAKDQIVISTIPMPALCDAAFLEYEIDFQHWPITVNRYQVDSADVFQTIYYPDPAINIYRATLTGKNLIVESTGHISPITLDAVLESFGISSEDVKSVSQNKQRYGKVAPIPDQQRKSIMFTLTSKLGVYSLGRFACWRNILMDDVYEDLFKIRRMVGLSEYDLFSRANK